MSSCLVIGAGLGGLECGYLLASRGFDVTVLEQDNAPGGALRSFRRGDALFDTGFHCIGSMEDGGELRGLFAELGLEGLPWVPMDGEEVVVGGRSFFIPSGYDAARAALTECFPESASQISAYLSELGTVASHREWLSESAFDFLCSRISDPLLRTVLSGTSLKMNLDPESLPLYVFARINDSFYRGGWRLSGGGQQIADTLVSGIEGLGGKVLCGARAVSVRADEGRAVAVETADGRSHEADFFISDLHPSTTAALVGQGFRKIYRSRLASLRNSFGMLTANIRLRPGVLPYENRNIYIYADGADPWCPLPEDGSAQCAMVSFGVPSEDGFARTLDILTPVSGEPSDKEALAGALVDFVSDRLPLLKDSIDRIFVSTPSTWERYTGTPGGSAYGVMKDWQREMTTVISPRTPLENFFLTGQNLSLHGVLGTTKTAFRTVEALYETMKNRKI